jgi:hypothetical protein
MNFVNLHEFTCPVGNILPMTVPRQESLSIREIRSKGYMRSRSSGERERERDSAYFRRSEIFSMSYVGRLSDQRPVGRCLFLFYFLAFARGTFFACWRQRLRQEHLLCILAYNEDCSASLCLCFGQTHRRSCSSRGLREQIVRRSK